VINIPYYRIDQPLFFPSPPKAGVVIVTPSKELFINDDKFDSSIFLNHYFRGGAWKISSLRYYKGKVLLMAEKAHEDPFHHRSALFYFTSPTAVSVTQAYLYQVQDNQLITYSIRRGEIQKIKFDFNNFSNYDGVKNFIYENGEVKFIGAGVTPAPSEYLFKIPIKFIADRSYLVYWMRNLVEIHTGRYLSRHHQVTTLTEVPWFGYFQFYWFWYWVYPYVEEYLEFSHTYLFFYNKIKENGKSYLPASGISSEIFNGWWREYYIGTSPQYFVAFYYRYLSQEERWIIRYPLYYLSSELTSVPEDQRFFWAEHGVFVSHYYPYYQVTEDIGTNSLVENLLERKKFLLISLSVLTQEEFDEWIVNQNYSKNYILDMIDKEKSRARKLVLIDKETNEYIYDTTTQEYGFRAVMLERRLKELDSKLSIQAELLPWIQVPEEILEKIYRERTMKEFYCLKIFRSTDELNLLVSKLPGHTAKVEYETTCTHRILDLDEFPSVTDIEQFYYNEDTFSNYPHLEGLDEEV